MKPRTDSVSICMPVLNEKSVINEVIEEWIKVIELLPGGSVLLIEDGGSKDGTREILQEVMSSYAQIRVIFRELPDGFGNAAKRLLGEAKTDWVFFTDGDGQYVAADFWKLWERRSGMDFVRGIKLGRQDPTFRRIASLIWNKCTKFLFELPVSDINAAFILMKREKLDYILPSARILKHMVISELLIRLVLDNSNFGKDVYILHRARKNGKSRATPGIKFFLIGFSQVYGLFKIKSDYRL
jgi:glycosyltransferase involved in cell wall biosynthesis